jgi:hypothetical protein
MKRSETALCAGVMKSEISLEYAPDSEPQANAIPLQAQKPICWFAGGQRLQNTTGSE